MNPLTVPPKKEKVQNLLISTVCGVCQLYGTEIDPNIEGGETLKSRWISDCLVNLISLDPATNKVSYYCFLAED